MSISGHKNYTTKQKGPCNPHCEGSAMGLCWVQPRPPGTGAGPGGQTGGLQADEH